MMKNKNILYGSSILILLSALLLVIPFGIKESARYSPREVKFNQTYSKNSQGIAGAVEYYHQRRKNINNGKVEIADMLKAEREVADFGSVNKSSSLGLDWIEMGPNDVGGRTRAILIDKNNPSRMYAGSVSGGLYISNTGGFSWVAYDDKMNNLAISSICQSANGDIYIGTGENLGVYPDGVVSSGTVGRGIFKSTDNGVTFDSLPATVPSDLDNESIAWAFVSRLAADPFDNLKIYAATNEGLKMTIDGGAVWTDAISNGIFDDVKVGSDGAVLATRRRTYQPPVIYAKAYLLKPGESVFTEITSALPGVDGAHRLEMAIAPSDPSYMYCCATSGDLHNLYQSKDGGTTWNIIVPAGGDAVFSDQGSYDLALAVFPDDKERVIVGGVELYAWSAADNTWDLIALTNRFPPHLYVHADKHTIVFSHGYGVSDYTFFIGTDGGVYASGDGGNTYASMNTGYSVTQFYAMGTSREGWVAGGTQDNGNPFIDFTGATTKSQTDNLPSGDGGYMQFSVIDPQVFFWESQNGGSAMRSPEMGSGAGDLFVSKLCNGACDEGYNEGPWVTPIVHWESFNDLSSTDSIQFVADQEYAAGSTIIIESRNASYPFKFVNPTALSVNDTIMIQDIVSSKLLACLYTGVWMTKDVLDFSKEPKWYRISSQVATCAEFSADGDVVFIGSGSDVYRISGLLGINSNDESTATIPQPTTIPIPSSVSEYELDFGNSQQVNGLGVDPNDADNLLITTGNYGSPNHVHLSSDALSVPTTFNSIQGNLPEMPVYDGIIEMHNPNVVVIATEYGIWSTTNAFDTPANVTWTNENNGFPRVPSFMILQQTHANNSCNGVINEGNIYVCTHGRGIWRSENYLRSQDTSACDLPVGIDESSITSGIEIDFHLYPNPASMGIANISYNINRSSSVNIKIYSIAGQIVQDLALGKKSFGQHEETIDVTELQVGTYFVSLVVDGYQKTERLVLLR